MPNWCNLKLTVEGPAEDRERFALVFRSAAAEVVGGGYDGEPFADLGDGTWGYIDKAEVRIIWLAPVWTWCGGPSADLDDTVLEHGDRLEIRGYCAWSPPVAWLEAASNLMPSLKLTARATIE